QSSVEKGEVRSGLTISGAYADKLRRVLFAQFIQKIKSGEISKEDVARASRELNTFLYHLLVEKLKLEKDDVVRITVKYELQDREIKWDYENLKIDAYRKIPQSEVRKIIAETVKHVKEVIEGKHVIEEVGKTITGDTLYKIRLGGVDIGVLEVIGLDDEVIVKGALTSPDTVIIEKARIGIGGKEVSEVLLEKINELAEKGRKVSRQEAEETIKFFLSKVKTTIA
ncbi:MAG: DUF2258 domain-containing protein, partial [Nitrososphaerota archaeon]